MTRMPPQFKKPLEYNPSLAEETLAKSLAHSEAAIRVKKNTMLAELGLADEEVDVDDEDEDDDILEDDDEQPIFRNGNGVNGKHPGTGATVPSTYSYKDVFGKEYEKRRQQWIDMKGYDRFLQDMVSRSNESLQLLRSDRGIQYPGAVEVIVELQHELMHLNEANKGLKTQVEAAVLSPKGAAPAAPAAAVANPAAVAKLEERIKELQAKSTGLEAQLKARDASINELQESLRKANAQALSSASMASAKSEAASATQIEHLEAALQKKESQLHDAVEEVKKLQAAAVAATAGGAGAGAAAAAALAELRAAERQRDEAQQLTEVLRGQVSSLQAELSAKEAEFARKLQEVAAASEHEQAQSLQKQIWTLTEQHARRVEELEAEIKQKGVIISQLQSAKADALAKMEGMSAKVQTAKTDAAVEVKSKLDGMYAIIDELHAFREGVLSELLTMQAEVFNDKTMTQMVRMVRDKEIASIRKTRADMGQEVTAARQQMNDIKDQMEVMREQYEQTLRIKELEAQGLIKHLQEKWRGEFEKRKKLHNQVLELKGNIRVLCRVRPLLEKERFNGSSGGGEEPAMGVKVMNEETLKVAGEKGEKDFEFDRVFSLDEDQEKVFEEVTALVTSVLDGYNVCIMAYGQTGSGKTFTMEGPDNNPGVNSRALAELFKLAGDRSADFGYTFQCSVLEIYNEQIYDLLSSTKVQDDKLDIKQGPEGMYVPGLRVEEVGSMADVNSLMHRGKQNRSTFATNMNEHSSRSHLVLSVYILSTNKATGAVLRGKLHLIDLAGSERISRTNAQGDRLKEAQNINKSLSALGDVIQALQQRNAHIPYRNSKLTRLLEDSLGGNSKCVMVVNISPALENTGESKCSLEFAARARKVELGRARQNLLGGDGGPGTPRTPQSAGPSGRTTPGDLSRVSSTNSVATGNGSGSARKPPVPRG